MAIRDIIGACLQRDIHRDARRGAKRPTSHRVMIFIPLPFVVALFLVTFLVQMIRRGEAYRDEGGGGWRENRFFFLLIAAYALQSVLIGLRWGYELRAVFPFQTVLAAAIPGLSWVAFRSLASERPLHGLALWLHFLPPVLVALLLVVWRAPIGALIILSFLGYGLALAWLARSGPDGLIASRLDGAIRSYRSLQVTAFAIIGSAVTDIVISFDMERSGGSHAGAIIAGGNMLALLILGVAASVAGAPVEGDAAMGDGVTAERDVGRNDDRGSGSDDPGEVTATAGAIDTVVPSPAGDAAQDEAIVAALDALMQEKRIYKDVDLNLNRLARRLNLPARSVSGAINRRHGMNVSQYVNTYRVKEACRLLSETDEPVTRIIFESGFLTKSNFNREFLRVTGSNPSAWRQKASEGAAAKAEAL
ncbi:MAG TPA: helix-turn-helix domain-containing protein [Terriglobia bacterium]|nr:helix-turn-helix domain-containing protein [Terriglobia bacterium]